MVLLPPETNVGVALILGSNNERHGMGTAKSIGGYDSGRAGRPLLLIKNVAENQADLLLPEWPSALDITNEVLRLREAVDEYSLNRIWFSAHARVDGTVTMITTPEISRVS